MIFQLNARQDANDIREERRLIDIGRELFKCV